MNIRTLQEIGRPIAFYPRLARCFGSVNSALFFCQLMYWSDKTDNPIGVWKSQDQVEGETGLSPKEQLTARKRLVDLGVLIETHKRLEHRIFFRIDFDRADELLSAEGSFPNPPMGVSGNPNKAVGGAPKAAAAEPPSGESCIGAETTSETTSETTHPKGASVAVVKAALPSGFARFWVAYKPAKERRTDKPRCLKLWSSQGLEARADEIVAHVEACAKSDQWLRGYAPMSATYLQQCRFDDDVPPPPSGVKSANAPSFFEAEQSAKAERASQFMPSRKAAPAAVAVVPPLQTLVPGADGVLQIGGAA